MGMKFNIFNKETNYFLYKIYKKFYKFIIVTAFAERIELKRFIFNKN
jgi:hypothetical protein